jgi:hypothetical protein
VAWSLTATPAPTALPPSPTAPPLPAAPATATPTAPAPAQAQPAAAPAAGPWLVYTLGSGSQVIARDAAGTAPLSVPLASPILWPGDLSAGASPSGGWLAVRTGQRNLTDLSLDLIRLPETAVQLHTPLLSAGLVKDLQATASGLPAPAAAVSQPDSLRWSPDGRYLAFVSAADGPSADLYIFDTQTQQVRRLTDGLNQVASPMWSPDGLWVIFQEVVNFSASPGWKLGAVWAAAADHNEVRKLYVPPTNSTGEGFLTWGAPDMLISFTRAPDAVHDVRGVPISARFVNRLYDGPLDQLAFDPSTQSLAFSETAQTGAGLGLATGLYLLPGTQGSPQFVRAGSWGNLAYSAPLKRFLSAGDQGLLLFGGGKDAVLLKDEANGLASPDGNWLVCWSGHGRPGVRLYQPDGSPLQDVAADPVAQLFWQPDSQAFYYLAGDRLFRAAFPAAQPVELDQGVVPGSLGWLGTEGK